MWRVFQLTFPFLLPLFCRKRGCVLPVLVSPSQGRTGLTLNMFPSSFLSLPAREERGFTRRDALLIFWLANHGALALVKVHREFPVSGFIYFFLKKAFQELLHWAVSSTGTPPGWVGCPYSKRLGCGARPQSPTSSRKKRGPQTPWLPAPCSPSASSKDWNNRGVFSAFHFCYRWFVNL